ncbi:hypothetical protein EKO27_g2858 [Xylaria grammica]|uniref:CID domain-containing protein n=1 Tax=Xylaria grammica TaxID=363999 RepID=A0A439DCY1_9PEZI|nr:hypothetical protein EKO27_g2858 [Xylaria grammica]
MSSAVAELEAGLNAMQNLKPPGVSGSRITTLTALCVNNVQSESVLIQKIYTHFKKAPATHKLGVLYVVDSVTRKWVDQAKQHGQPINSAAQDGTYAAGVHRVTELLPVLMNDIIQNAPGEQKEKIKKLVDIWEKGQTFPVSMIESFKQKLNAPTVSQNESTTPVGSPPPGAGLPGLSETKPPVTEAPNAIMEALANIARQNITVPPPSVSVPAAAGPFNLPPTQQPTLQTTQNQASAPAPASFLPVAHPINVPSLSYPYAPQAQTQAPVQSQPFVPPVTASNQAPGFPGVAPGAPLAAAAGGVDPNVQQQVMLIKLLADQGVPVDKIPLIIAGIQNGGAPGAAVTPSASSIPSQPQLQPGQPPYGSSWGQEGFRSDESRDRSFTQVRSPSRYHDRSRSRSPPRHWDQRGRDYGGFGPNSPGGGRMDDRDRRGRGPDYRQRSPQGRRGRSPTPPQDFPRPGAKWVEIDRTLPQGHIKVLSRTLFVGGVTCSEAELRSVFGRHGQVQTCIVNKDKRHAFVKMVTRRDAVHAKEAMESGSFRTRWGVGFGPRDCSDYQTGISVIPISKLTEADRKWMLTAEFGGSGGRQIETGLVVEEPDIEIGAGVSSKAISRRMQTDKGGRHGPKSSRSGDEDDFGRWRGKREQRQDNGPPNDQSQGQADFSQFPFGIGTGPNGMPVFPPGFSFPAPDQYNGAG